MGIAILPTYNSNVVLYEDQQHVCYIDNIVVNPSPTGISGPNTEKTAIEYSDGKLTLCGAENGPANITVYDTNGCAVTAAELTVENGKMTIHISLVSKKIVNLFVGTADDAKKDGADILEPTTDTVKYSDGTTDEVYGFDVPVEALDEEFDLALRGTKGEWYDHKVSVSDPQETDN